MVKVKVTDKVIDVPLFTLIPQSALALEQLDIEFEGKIHSFQESEVRDVDGDGDVDEHDLSSSTKDVHIDLKSNMFNSNSSPVKIKISFSGKDAPEGLMQLNDHFVAELKKNANDVK